MEPSSPYFTRAGRKIPIENSTCLNLHPVNHCLAKSTWCSWRWEAKPHHNLTSVAESEPSVSAAKAPNSPGPNISFGLLSVLSEFEYKWDEFGKRLITCQGGWEGVPASGRVWRRQHWARPNPATFFYIISHYVILFFFTAILSDIHCQIKKEHKPLLLHSTKKRKIWKINKHYNCTLTNLINLIIKWTLIFPIWKW